MCPPNVAAKAKGDGGIGGTGMYLTMKPSKEAVLGKENMHELSKQDAMGGRTLLQLGFSFRAGSP